MTLEPVRVGADALLRALPYADAVDALEEAFRLFREDENPPRAQHVLPDGELLIMPAHSEAGVGIKLVTLNEGNSARGLPLIHGVYVLFSPGTLEPELIMDGAGLTRLRTAAVSALATRHLARPDARRLVIFGAGAQSAAHVEAIRAVRPIDHVAIVGTGSPRTLALVEQLQARGLDACLGTPEAVRDADIVCTCTTSRTALFDADLVAPGTHVNAVGVYHTTRRELPGELLTRALIVVETREAALDEAGDLVLAIAEGHIDADSIAGELHDVVTGGLRRTSDDEITVFKSVGLAMEDLVVARAAASRLDEGAAV